MTRRSIFNRTSRLVFTVSMLFAFALWPAQIKAQQKELPEVSILTAVSNMAFSAVWVAEQLKYFEQEGVRAKITPAGGGAPCQTAVVGRSANLCASSSEGLVLAKVEGAPLIAIQAHNRNLTLSIAVRKAIVDKFKLTRSSSLNDRIKALAQLGTIGATSPGAVSEQIFKFLVSKVKGDTSKLKFVYLGGTELPVSLMNGVIDALAQSPPSAEVTEAAGKGYVLIPLGIGEVSELTNYPYEVLMARPDWAEQNPNLAAAAVRAISRGGALYHTDAVAFKAALRAHRFSDPTKLDDNVFDLAYSMIASHASLGQHESGGLAEGNGFFHWLRNHQRQDQSSVRERRSSLDQQIRKVIFTRSTDYNAPGISLGDFSEAKAWFPLSGQSVFTAFQ